MLLVKTEVKQSAIHGLGLFAKEPLKKGQAIWWHNPLFEIVFSPDDLSSLPLVAREFTQKYAYRNSPSDNFIVNLDDARFFNHSDVPNTAAIGDFMLATRDIAVDEELTCDYFSFDCASEKLGIPKTAISVNIPNGELY